MSSSGNKKYLAMRQVYDYEKDADGKIIYYEQPNPYYREGAYPQGNGAPKTISRPKYVKVEGKFRAFGNNGKVVSLYDSPGKAARYCGKEGYVAEMDPADCRKYNCSVEEQLVHCENRMLFWGQETTRLENELKNING